ncbi:MAG: Nif3-like dinuclear metal center hexameric protein, partial [Parcubacteria group bacterium]|nr:Nif3-like dinuclear metal center hexameric protein [Parcubacteria group bacterium]
IVQSFLGFFPKADIHTNLDSTSGGLNDLLAKKLHLKNTRPLLPNPQHPKVGLGRVGRLSKPIGFDQLCQNLMRAFGLAHLRYVGNKKARLGVTRADFE